MRRAAGESLCGPRTDLTVAMQGHRNESATLATHDVMHSDLARTHGLSPDDFLVFAGSMFQVKAFLVANKVGLFGAVASSAKTVDELAAELGLDARAVHIVLRAMAAKGFLAMDARRAFTLSASARDALDPASPSFIGPWLENHDNVWDALGALENTIRSGKPALPTAHYRVSQQQHEHFVRATHNTAVINAPILASKLDMQGVRSLLDLGGGPGSYAVFFCLAHPGLRATVFDLPASGPVARDIISQYKLKDRIEFCGGDYFTDAVRSGYDACLISHIIHAYSPQNNLVLLRKAFAALNPGGRLWVHDFILGADETQPEFPSGFAVRMLAVTEGGDVYSSDEISSWCREVGFSSTRWLDFGQARGVSIIEAVK
jgi:SAM-dependent methyltransferase